MRIPLFILISVSLPLLVTASLAQSNKKDGEATKLTSSIKLVLIPTIVTDQSGGHVSGLKIESFGLQEDGKSRRVAVSASSRKLPTTNSSASHASSGNSSRWVTARADSALNSCTNTAR